MPQISLCPPRPPSQGDFYGYEIIYIFAVSPNHSVFSKDGSQEKMMGRQLRNRDGLLRRMVGRLANDRMGATAVEFALIAGPFIFVLMATLELAFVYLVATSLDAATAKTAREIKTGQMQLAGETQTQFANAVCANMGWLASQCPSSLSVSVQSFSNFSSVAPPAPISNGVFDPSVLTFNMGNSGDIVLVKAYYQWPLFTPFLDVPLQALQNGNAVIVATTVFRNEPYS